jgi:hypothetical protein
MSTIPIIPTRELSLKYDNLIQDCSFEEIPLKFKIEVAKCFTDADRYIPIQLNGIIGNANVNKRLSGGRKEIPGATLVNISSAPPKELKSEETEKVYGSGENV